MYCMHACMVCHPYSAVTYGCNMHVCVYVCMVCVCVCLYGLCVCVVWTYVHIRLFVFKFGTASARTQLKPAYACCEKKFTYWYHKLQNLPTVHVMDTHNTHDIPRFHTLQYTSYARNTRTRLCACDHQTLFGIAMKIFHVAQDAIQNFLPMWRRRRSNHI